MYHSTLRSYPGVSVTQLTQNVLEYSTNFPCITELNLTAATVIILFSQGPTDCGDACFLVQVPNSCLTDNTVMQSALLYNAENSEGDMRLVDDEDIGVEDVQLDCK